MSNPKVSDFSDWKPIGKGAFGVVYQATLRKKLFALKEMSKRKLQRGNMLEQFDKQIKISTQLKHKNIIKIYQCIENNQNFYLVLQLAEKGLFDELKKVGRFSESKVKQMIRDVVDGVEYLHSRQPPIIHRDIKPQNLLLDRNGTVKLADFGWSTFRDTKARKTYCGTIDYLAPEMIEQTGHDERLDIWCIGVLVYELLTGRTPFIDNIQGSKRQQAIYDNIRNVRIQFPEGFPTLAKSFVMGMIKRNPNERMTLQQIKNHPWLNEKQQKMIIPQQISIPKAFQKKNSYQIQQANNQLVRELHKKIRDLEQQNMLQKLKLQQVNTDNKGTGNRQEEISKLMHENRKLRVTEQMNLKYKKQQEKLWEQINQKDKEIIRLKTCLKQSEDLAEEITELKNEKGKLQEKTKKLQKQVKSLQQKNKNLQSQLQQANSGIAQRVKGGQQLDPSEISSPQFIKFLQEQITDLGQKFQISKNTLTILLEKQKKQTNVLEELAKYRSQYKNMQKIIRAELRQMYENEKDDLLLKARTQMAEEKQKWLKQRQQLRNIYEQNSGQTETTVSRGINEDLQAELRNMRELNGYYEKSMKNQQLQLQDLRQEVKKYRGK